MASKQVFVKAHFRLIFTRTYKFICGECGRATDRETYAVKQPKYCAKCRPPKPPSPKRQAEEPQFQQLTLPVGADSN